MKKKVVKKNGKNKFTLVGTGNDGFRHRYSIRKNESFKKVFVDFMVDLDFEKGKIEGSFADSEENGKIIKFKIKEVLDVCSNYQNKKYDVDVFYGRFKIIIVVRTKQRIPMVNHLDNKSKWVKPLKIKPIREKKKVKVPLPIQGARN